MRPITSFDVAGTNLLLGCSNGSIYYIDMQKFPLRMKDNDLLISELFHDVNEHAITALSVYVSPSTSESPPIPTILFRNNMQFQSAGMYV